LCEILVVSISASEKAANGALDGWPQPIVECRGGVGIAGANTREKLAVIEGRGRKSRLRRACLV
jgi:hypothetical protein